MTTRAHGPGAVGLVVIAVASGCGGEAREPAPNAMPNNTAVVSIDGRELDRRLFVACRKQQWLLSIDTVDSAAGGFTAMIDSGPDRDVGFVKIRDVNGFTGSAWRDGVGEASARREAGVTTITGTAYGYFADSPGPVTVPFDIRTVC